MFHAAGERGDYLPPHPLATRSVGRALEDLMSDFDAAREAALRLALQHHMNGAEQATTVVDTARVFLEFLNPKTESDKRFIESVTPLLDTPRPLD